MIKYYVLFFLVLLQNCNTAGTSQDILFEKTKENSLTQADKFRLILRDDPSSTITIGWNQLSDSVSRVYYGTQDFGRNLNKYPNNQAADRETTYKGMKNKFVRLEELSANTTYFFVIGNTNGTSERFWFKTAPDDQSRLSFIAGGDSRNNRLPRQNANKLVAKLKPHAVFFGGDMTLDDTAIEWQTWLEDWQLTIAPDGRMFPIIVARGNHEYDPQSLYHLFDTPTPSQYYALTFGNDFFRIYSLNSQITEAGEQGSWLNNDLKTHQHVVWKSAQYHKPMRPHTSKKSEGNNEYLAWANLFYQYGVDLVVECDSHMVKTTWPIRPTTEAGHDEGFVRDDERGTVYVGEGCWGAPLRHPDDAKSWTRDLDSFNQFKLIFVDPQKMEVRTIRTHNADEVDEVNNNNSFELPQNIEVWNPSNGKVVEIKRKH